jgi:hypothetical protein
MHTTELGLQIITAWGCIIAFVAVAYVLTIAYLTIKGE